MCGDPSPEIAALSQRPPGSDVKVDLHSIIGGFDRSGDRSTNGVVVERRVHVR